MFSHLVTRVLTILVVPDRLRNEPVIFRLNFQAGMSVFIRKLLVIYSIAESIKDKSISVESIILILSTLLYDK